MITALLMGSVAAAALGTVAPPSGGAVSARHWRLKGTVAGAFDGGALSGIEFYSANDGVNIATGGTPSAGSEAFGGTAAQAFDGNSATNWIGASGAVAAGTSWVAYDFGSAVTVKAFEVTVRTSDEDQMWDEWDLEYSHDGVSWTVLSSYVDLQNWNSGASKVYPTPWQGPTDQPEHRYWRLKGTVVGGFDGGALSEIEFYGEADGFTLAYGGTPSAGSEAFGGTAEQAFNGNKSGSDLWAGASGAIAAGTSWVAYDFGIPVPVHSFEITARSGGNSNQMWDGWDLEWSDDGVAWTLQESFSDTGSWGSAESRSYTVTVSEFAGKVVMVNLAGQSNIIGRYGPIDGGLDATDPDVLMWNGSAWITAADPLDHAGEETADTVGPGLSFAKKLKADTGASKVLLVGNGLGGAGFMNDSWNALSSAHYESAETRWNAAHAQAVTDYGADLYVGGTLWLQAEDEIIDFSGAGAGNIDTANGGEQYFGMVLSMAHVMRDTLAGFTEDTPFVVMEVPPGSIMTVETLYDQIVAQQALVGTYLNRAAFAAGSDLATADDRHYSAAASRTIGERAATAIQSLSADPRAALPAFTPDAANVSTVFRFNVANEVNGGQLQMLGDVQQWDNRRVWINSGYLAFKDNAELRLGNQDRGLNPVLTNKDFLFKCKVRSRDTAAIQGIWSLWDGVAATSRSWVLRFRDDEIQFYYSTTGTDNTKALFHPVADNTWYEIEVKRVGDSLSLTVDSVVEDTHTLPSAGFSFWTPTNTAAKMLIGEYQNDFNLEGDIEYASLELLS